MSDLLKRLNMKYDLRPRSILQKLSHLKWEAGTAA